MAAKFWRGQQGRREGGGELSCSPSSGLAPRLQALPQHAGTERWLQRVCRLRKSAGADSSSATGAFRAVMQNPPRPCGGVFAHLQPHTLPVPWRRGSGQAVVICCVTYQDIKPGRGRERHTQSKSLGGTDAWEKYSHQASCWAAQGSERMGTSHLCWDQWPCTGMDQDPAGHRSTADLLTLPRAMGKVVPTRIHHRRTGNARKTQPAD